MQPAHLDITASIGSLAISPTTTKLSERRRQAPTHEMTLASISTDSSDILNRLLEDGPTREPLAFFNRDVTASPPSDFHRNPKSSKLPFKDGKVMPGTLIAPGPSFLNQMPPTQEASQYDDHYDSKVSVITSPQSPGLAAAPLARSMSIDERAAFLEGLVEVSRGPPATVYTIPVHELPRIAESSVKLGFHTGTVLPTTGSGEGGLLILGRDLGAVQDLFAKLSQDGAPQQSGVRAMASGAVAGAVATFAGLALA